MFENIDEKKLNILFVCNYFAPDNTIAAVRTSKLVKYFKLAGYSVDVLTEKKANFAVDESLLDDMKGVDVYYVENSSFFKRFYDNYLKFIKPHKDKRLANMDNRERVNPKTGLVEFYPFETAYPIIGSIEYIANQLRQFDLYKMSKKVTLSNDYDYIITSYGDSFSYFYGKYYKKKFNSIKWIFDIRDAVYRYKFTPEYVKWIPLKYEKNIWNKADAIVGVSKGICKRVPPKYRNKVHFIPNGFDINPNEDFGELSNYNKLSFAYTGSMYGGLQNLSKFFEAVNELILNNEIDKEIIEILYAGNNSAYEIFKNQANQYNLENCCIYVGKLTRNQAMEIQRKSHILLLASYDYKNNTGGIITGKLLEYMNSNRPVIAIVTGDVENSEVKQIINKTNIGLCYEASNNDNDFITLKNYILKQYKLFCNNESMEYNPNISAIQKFDYRNLTKKYIEILNTI